MAKSKRKAGNSALLSFTLEELQDKAVPVAVEHVSNDGRRVHRQLHHFAPSPKKMRAEENLDLSWAPFNEDEDLGLPDSEHEEEEKIKPRAKQYLSSVSHPFSYWGYIVTDFSSLGRASKVVETFQRRIPCRAITP
jgi:hypothetical protein